jgi:hypothetical protein
MYCSSEQGRLVRLPRELPDVLEGPTPLAVPEGVQLGGTQERALKSDGDPQSPQNVSGAVD